MAERSSQLIFFIGVSLSLILLMGLFIVSIILFSRKKQMKFQQVVQQMQIKFDNDILKAQIEIQEQTFHDISREIHDNINLSLTLAKLKLNTMSSEKNYLCLPIELIGKAINDLTDLSRSLNSDIIKDCGLISALTMEIERIEKVNPLKIEYKITGIPVFLESKKELFIFRILQEALNNIIKHSKAQLASIHLHYEMEELRIQIKDDGCGFTEEKNINRQSRYQNAGLLNMKKRIELLNGRSKIISKPEHGTTLIFEIPINK